MDHLFGIDLVSLVKAVGLVGVLAIIFAESGLLIGFFLPGDSLLFTAGFLAAQNLLNIWLLVPGAFVAAVLGDNVGYAFGRRVGPRIFRREKSFFFSPENLERSKRFYERHGPITLVLARFMPALRTFVPILAGVGGMHYQKFFRYNVLGAVLWAIGLPLAGFFLDSIIPGIDRYIIPIVAGIIIISVLPSAVTLLKSRR